MATNEVVDEARQAAMAEATTDRLDDVSPPMSPESEPKDAPEFRADVGAGRWQAPPSAWRISDSIFLRLKEGKTAGPFTVVYCHPPRDRNDKWRYDIRDATGRTKSNISGSIMF